MLGLPAIATLKPPLPNPVRRAEGELRRGRIRTCLRWCYFVIALFEERSWPAHSPMAADLNNFKVLEHSFKLQVRVSSEGAGTMNSVIYLIGFVVVVLAILSFLGFH